MLAAEEINGEQFSDTGIRVTDDGVTDVGISLQLKQIYIINLGGKKCCILN